MSHRGRMDWSGCELVEIDVSGVARVRGTSVTADAVMAEIYPQWELETIAAKFPEVPLDDLQGVLTYGCERLGWDTETLVDWSGCDLVEQVPGRCSGAPTVVGTRIFPDTVATYYWDGATAEEIREDYPSLPEDTIRGLIRYVKLHEVNAA